MIKWILEVEKDTTQIPQETTSEETINSDVLKDSLAMTSSSITMQQLKKNSMKLEKITIKKLIESYKKQPRRDVLDPSFTSPTSLPLYFYFGFQLLQESNQWEECGHVCWYTFKKNPAISKSTEAIDITENKKCTSCFMYCRFFCWRH